MRKTMILAVFAAFTGGIFGSVLYSVLSWKHGAQTAEGEWRIELQTPPCDSPRNLQIIWPKESGAPLTVECDAMPVKQR